MTSTKMKDEPVIRNCTDCKWCVLIDYGYSNYTVEGTSFNCAKKLHPDGTFDQFYGEDKRLEFAEKCASFEKGDCVTMDVDFEGLDSLTEEQKEIYDMV